jgi:putative Holliday junction resolvase
MAFDPGGKRTGVAVGDDRTGIVSPVKVVEAPGDAAHVDTLIEALMNVIAEHRPDALVVGVPINMDDTEGPAARWARALGERLGARAALPVHFQDERLSSYAADQAMARSGRTHRQKKNLRDALAAAEILRDFLESA